LNWVIRQLEFFYWLLLCYLSKILYFLLIFNKFLAWILLRSSSIWQIKKRSSLTLLTILFFLNLAWFFINLT
jgi:hypothetical protein